MSNDQTFPEGPTDPRLSAAPPEDATSIIPGFGPPPDQPPPGYGQPTELAYGPAGSPTAVAPPPPPPAGPPGSPAGGGRVYAGTTGGGESTSEQPVRKKQSSDRGRTTITDEVVERVIKKVVDLVVADVEGVSGLYAGDDAGFLPGAAARDDGGDGDPASAPVASGPVVVDLDDGRASIDLSIEVEFGHAVHEVVDQVRAGVISRTERLLGLTVAQVNVVVAEVAFEAGE